MSDDHRDYSEVRTMRVEYLKRDFYKKIYDKIYLIESNISNRYLNQITEGKVQMPYITLKTSAYTDNVGTQFVSHRMGDIAITVYHTDYEAMCNIVSEITTSIESIDDELYLIEYNEDDDMIEDKYYTKLDIKMNLYPDGSAEV